MKANELRIGNYIIPITSDGFKLEQRPIHAREFWLSSNEPDKAEPIPLTEEWLIKFGFKKRLDDQYSDFKKVCVGILSDSFYVGVHFGYEYYEYITKVKYVHQLQNLYFALTGEELILKK